jgi:ATP-dependent DNA helicase RecG
MGDSISKINPILTMDYIKNSKENQYFDRKSAKVDSKEIAKHLIAFANANGGLLIIGVEDDGRVTRFSNVGI